MSIFDKMAANKTLKKNLAKAKAVVPNQQKSNEDFPGADGEYHFRWMKLREWEAKKTGDLYSCFDMVCIDEGEVSKFPMGILIGFVESAAMTVEDKQEQFFETLQLLGVETADLELSDMQKAADVVMAEEHVYLCSVTTSKNKKYKNLRIKEILSDKSEWQKENEAAGDVDPAGDDDSGEDAAVVNPNVADNPSDWEGYTCNYGEYKGLFMGDCNDDAQTVTLTDDDDEVVELDVPWGSVTPIDEE
jgi:hypothetical protein